MKHTVFAIFGIFLCLQACSRADTPIAAFDSATCVNTLSRLNTNDDDLSCAEINSELNKIERDCNRFLDDESRANIAALRLLCVDD